MEAYEKYIMQSLYVPPYLLLFIKGGLSFIWALIAFLLVLFFNLEFLHFTIILRSTSQVLFYLILISSFLLNIFRTLTIHFYNPIYRYVADILVILYVFIQHLGNYLDRQSIGVIIIYGLSILVIIISILVYQEVIIINAWGLDKDTSKQIQQRASNDFADEGAINESMVSIDSDFLHENNYELYNVNTPIFNPL